MNQIQIYVHTGILYFILCIVQDELTITKIKYFPECASRLLYFVQTVTGYNTKVHKDSLLQQLQILKYQSGLQIGRFKHQVFKQPKTEIRDIVFQQINK